MDIVRTWKRDGSTNTMSFDCAVANLASRTKDKSLLALDGPSREREIARRLVAGQSVETPLAVFCRERVDVRKLWGRSLNPSVA